MARGINKVFILGNLGQEPDVRYTPSGDPIVNLSIATSESWNDKTTGQKQERTEWHRVVMFNKLAEIAVKYLHKGSKLYVEGQLRTRKWEDKEGVERYTTEIVARDIEMLDPAPQGSTTTAEKPAAPTATQREPVLFDDDIPF